MSIWLRTMICIAQHFVTITWCPTEGFRKSTDISASGYRDRTALANSPCILNKGVRPIFNAILAFGTFLSPISKDFS